MSEPGRVRRAVGWGMPVVTVLGLAATLVWSGALSSPEGLLGRSFESAMAQTETDAGAPLPTPVSLNGAAPVKAVRAVWPGTSAESFALQRPLTLGDHITISSAGGRPEKLAIVGLAEVDGAAIGAPGVKFQMVTSKADGNSAALVRFLVAIEPTKQAANQDAGKTL